MTRRLGGRFVDLAPDWLWKPGNLRWIGGRTLHFCYAHGKRTVEVDGRVLISGLIDRSPPPEISRAA